MKTIHILITGGSAESGARGVRTEHGVSTGCYPGVAVRALQHVGPHPCCHLGQTHHQDQEQSQGCKKKKKRKSEQFYFAAIKAKL